MGKIAYLRRKEAAALARVSPKTIDRWRRAGKLAARRAKIGTLFFLKADVEALALPPRAPRREAR